MAEIPRRTLLSRGLLGSALVGGGLLGLTRPIKRKVAVPPPPPPVALTDALARQRRLLDGYEQVLARTPAQPGLAGLRADVAAHGNALRAVLQRYPGWRLSTGSPAPRPAGTAATGTPVDTVSTLAAASRAAAAAASQACLDWPATEAQAREVVPLLGSIAASLASHARVLG